MEGCREVERFHRRSNQRQTFARLQFSLNQGCVSPFVALKTPAGREFDDPERRHGHHLPRYCLREEGPVEFACGFAWPGSGYHFHKPLSKDYTRAGSVTRAMPVEGQQLLCVALVDHPVPGEKVVTEECLPIHDSNSMQNRGLRNRA